jgi:hypothetical protein
MKQESVQWQNYKLRYKTPGSVKHGKLPQLAEQISASQEGLHEIWGNQAGIEWGYKGA